MSFGNLAYGGDQRSYSFEFFHADIIPFSATAVQCPDMPCEQVWIQNDPDSSGDCLIGSDRLKITGLGYRLAPGNAIVLPIKNVSLIYHKDEASSHLNYAIVR